jgi:hypothetical protein
MELEFSFTRLLLQVAKVISVRVKTLCVDLVAIHGGDLCEGFVDQLDHICEALVLRDGSEHPEYARKAAEEDKFSPHIEVVLDLKAVFCACDSHIDTRCQRVQRLANHVNANNHSKLLKGVAFLVELLQLKVTQRSNQG